MANIKNSVNVVKGRKIHSMYEAIGIKDNNKRLGNSIHPLVGIYQELKQRNELYNVELPVEWSTYDNFHDWAIEHGWRSNIIKIMSNDGKTNCGLTLSNVAWLLNRRNPQINADIYGISKEDGSRVDISTNFDASDLGMNLGSIKSTLTNSRTWYRGYQWYGHMMQESEQLQRKGNQEKRYIDDVTDKNHPLRQVYSDMLEDGYDIDVAEFPNYEAFYTWAISHIEYTSGRTVYRKDKDMEWCKCNIGWDTRSNLRKEANRYDSIYDITMKWSR